MLTTAASRAPPGARVLYTNKTSTALLRAAGSSSSLSLVQSRNPGQTRHFRFGRWSCPSEPETQAHRDLRCRHGRFKYRYVSAINRKLSWGHHHNASTEDHKSAVKTVMGRYWSSTGKPGQYIDVDKLKSWSDELSGTGAGVRPGRNIEDVERNAINYLFHGHNRNAVPGVPYEYDPWQSPFDNIRNYMASKNSGSAAPGRPSGPSSDEVVTIDPITNRRVHPQPTTDASTIAAGPTSSRAHFTLPQSLRGNAEIIHSDGPPPAEELQKYKPVMHQHLDSAAFETSAAANASSGGLGPIASDADKYEAVKWSEPDGLPPKTTEELSKQYQDLDNYGPLKWREPAGTLPPTPEVLSKNYTDVDQYGPVQWREPDGLPKLTTEEQSKEYSDLHQYNAVQFNEPEGQLPLTAEERSKQYEDLDKYNAIKFNEPEGQMPPTAEERSKQYDDLCKYEAVAFNEELDGQLPLTTEERSKQYEDLDKYQPIKFNEAIDGKLPPTAEELSKQYEDVNQYGPVRFNEPDGQLPLSMEELSKLYADLSKYKPVAFNEVIDGKLPPTAEELSKQYTDLHKYEPVAFNEELGGKLPPSPEELSKQYTDLHKYGPVMWNEPDGKLPLTAEEKSKQYEDLDYYTPVQFNEPNGQLPPSQEVLSKQYDDLHQYTPVQFNEPDGKLPITAEEKSKQYDDLHHYTPVKFNEPDGKLPLSAEEKSKHYKDLNKYEPVKWNEPDGKLPEQPEEISKRYNDLHKYKPVQWNEPDGQAPEHPEEASKRYTDLHGYTGPFKHNEPDGKSTKPHQSSAEFSERDSAILQYERGWDIANKAARTTTKQARLKAATAKSADSGKTMTGNYLRDFPEDFAVSWSTMLGSKASEPPTQEIDESEIASFDEGFPALEPALEPYAASYGASRLQPALDRAGASSTPKKRHGNLAAQADPYSTEPQGLELSYAEEMSGRKTWPAFVRMYGTANSASATSGSNVSKASSSSSAPKKPEGKSGSGASAAGSTETPEPSCYKILAYDPTMQTISTADTTSVVKDNAVPLTPPEVMMRLSNPIKFFPHLAPLQAQGYEIVSGSGDVLVFRKVRDVQPDAEAPKTASYQPPRVNPIDMMGSQPVTPHSYSASPTGYLNYDDCAEAEISNKPLPPFREPSRGRAEKATPDPAVNPKPKKFRKSKKVLVGAASVGGLTYAAGVVGEFFKTGGSDGKGPSSRF